jgi:hypothetical protein
MAVKGLKVLYLYAEAPFTLWTFGQEEGPALPVILGIIQDQVILTKL